MSRYLLTEEENKLLEMIDKYCNSSGELAEDAPEEAKKALERLREIGKERDELEISLW